MSPNRLDIDMFCQPTEQKPHMPTTPTVLSLNPSSTQQMAKNPQSVNCLIPYLQDLRMKATGEHGMGHIATFKCKHRMLEIVCMYIDKNIGIIYIYITTM